MPKYSCQWHTNADIYFYFFSRVVYNMSNGSDSLGFKTVNLYYKHWFFHTDMYMSSTGASKLVGDRQKEALQTDRFPEALAGGGRARGAERAPPSAVDSASPLLRADQAEKLPLQLLRRWWRRRRHRPQADHAPVVENQQRSSQRRHVAP